VADNSTGEMDSRPHEKTYSGFITFTKRSVIAIIVFLLFLALVNG
jgi:hypothetical protein